MSSFLEAVLGFMFQRHVWQPPDLGRERVHSSDSYCWGLVTVPLAEAIEILGSDNVMGSSEKYLSLEQVKGKKARTSTETHR